MTPDDPKDAAAALARLRAQSPPDDAAAALAKLRAAKPAGHDYHAEYASGALQKRMAGANARDQANAQENTEVVGPVAAAGHALGATMANMGEGIPGFEALQAGTRALVRGQPYGEALGDLRRETGKLPTTLKAGERIVGAMPLTKFLPGSAIKSGAILGALDGATDADPTMGAGQRVGGAALGAVGGALVGKVGEGLVTGARAAFSKTAAANVLGRKAEQALSAKRLYGAAIAAGQGKEPTPAVQAFLQQPDIAGIVERLQQTRPFQGVEAHDPRMLDEIYKTLSDHVKSLRKGLAAVDPRNANSARVAMDDARQAQSGLLSALETPGSATGSATSQPMAREAPPLSDGPLRARTEGGRLKSFAKSTDEELAGEYAALVDANAVENTAPSSIEADGGAYQWVGQKKGAMRAEGRIAQRKLTIAKVEDELRRRGIKPEDAYWIGKPGDASEAALSHADDAAGDTSFDFGANTQPAGSNAPAMMPGYRHAVQDFAQRASGIEGVERGAGALRNALSKKLTAPKQLTRTTPESLQEWAHAADDASKTAAGEGVLGGVKEAFQKAPLTLGRKALAKAPGVMRNAAVPSQALSDMLTKLGLLSGNALLQP